MAVMNLRDLRYLVALADERHFGRAAERSSVSQPTLSAQIRKLEEYLGVALVERQPKRVALTPAGVRIVERARRLLQEADAIVEAWEVEARLEGAQLPEPRPHVWQPGRGRFREIWKPPYLGRTVMLIAFNIVQAAGYYGFASWVPTLLIASGVEVTKSLGYTFLIAIAAPFGPALGLFFTDRIERKWVVAGAALAIAASGLVFSQASGMVAAPADPYSVALRTAGRSKH